MLLPPLVLVLADLVELAVFPPFTVPLVFPPARVLVLVDLLVPVVDPPVTELVEVFSPVLEDLLVFADVFVAFEEEEDFPPVAEPPVAVSTESPPLALEFEVPPAPPFALEVVLLPPELEVPPVAVSTESPPLAVAFPPAFRLVLLPVLVLLPPEFELEVLGPEFELLPLEGLEESGGVLPEEELPFPHELEPLFEGLEESGGVLLLPDLELEGELPHELELLWLELCANITGLRARQKIAEKIFIMNYVPLHLFFIVGVTFYYVR
jgi:hypothetical protein